MHFSQALDAAVLAVTDDEVLEVAEQNGRLSTLNGRHARTGDHPVTKDTQRNLFLRVLIPDVLSFTGTQLEQFAQSAVDCMRKLRPYDISTEWHASSPAGHPC